MYESYYGLKEKPFSILPDPDFLFFSRRHRMAYTMLEYGVENRAGFTVVTGEIGSGKTTLVRCLLNNLPDTTNVGLVSNTHQGLTNLLEWVMLAFGQPYDQGSHVALFDAFQQFLIKEYGRGRRTILIIDEAQNLRPAVLEELRLLSNINADKHQLLQMILIGQPQLQRLLSRPELQQFAQRVAVDFCLRPLESQEVEAYICHRLKVAGRSKPLFTGDACRVISRISKGIPRTINILCDTALVYGLSTEATRIDAAVVEQVVKDRQDYGVFTPQPEEVRDAETPPEAPVDDGHSVTGEWLYR